MKRVRQTFVGRDGEDTGARLAFRTNENDLFEITYYDVAGQVHTAVAAIVVKACQWYHLAAVSDGTTLKLYVDECDGNGYLVRGATKLTTSGPKAGAPGSMALSCADSNDEW